MWDSLLKPASGPQPSTDDPPAVTDNYKTRRSTKENTND